MKKYLVRKKAISEIGIKQYFNSIFSNEIVRIRTKKKLPESELVRLLKKGKYVYLLKKKFKILDGEIDFLI